MDNVIPINRAVISAMTRVLDAMKECKWRGPSKMNAILIDRKGFMKTMDVPYPPKPYIQIAEMPPIRMTFLEANARLIPQDGSRLVDFAFYQIVGGVCEYREI